MSHVVPHLALDWEEISTRRRGDHMAHVFPPLQNEVSAGFGVAVSFPCSDLLCNVDKILV